MDEQTEITIPGRKSASALGSCAQCGGVFPVLDMRAHEGQMYCRTCHRKVGGVDLVRGPPPPLPVTEDGEEPPALLRPDAEAEMFARYAELRQRIDSGEVALEVHKEAAETASRLGLGLEAAEHYRECLRLDPENDNFLMRLDNVELQLRRSGQRADPTKEAELEARIPKEARPFWRDLGAVLAYPFQGRGPSLMVVAGLFFGILWVIAQVNLIGLIIMLCMLGYVSAYLQEVISSTASGKDQPPDFPEPTSFLESYIYPFFSFLTCMALSYSPCLLLVWMMTEGWMGVGLGAFLMLGGIAFGTFVFPMTLIVKALFQDIWVVLRPQMVFGSIGRILPDYIAAFVAICAVWVGYAIATSAMFLVLTVTLGRPTADAMLEAEGPRVFSWVLLTIGTWPLLLYALLLQGHLMGRLYRQGVRRLAWFHPPTAETYKAARLSVGVGLAGLAAAFLLCGTFYGAFLLYSNVAGNPTGFALGQSSPIQPGSRLTYHWTHTDGQMGLTVYRFTDGGDGTVHVSSTTQVLGGMGIDISNQEVGDFDAHSGIYERTYRMALRSGTPQQAGGEHTIFYGPTSASSGDVYINTWPVRGTKVFKGTWNAWKVHDPMTTADLYYDQDTGIYVGRRLVGIGFVVDEWLVEAQGIDGLKDGPSANYDAFQIGPFAK